MANSSHRTTALITGGSNGIGFAIAQKFADNDIEVVIADIVPPIKISERITYTFCDVTKAEDVSSLFDFMQSRQPDILVLNAGKGIHERLIDGDPEKWMGVFDLNVMGVLRCIRAFVPTMQQHRGGNVVFISSIAAKKHYSYGGIYSASKTAVEMIAETLRVETMPNIAVTTIRAGITDTSFFNERQDKELLLQQMGCLQAKEIAEDVYYAISKPSGSVINAIVTRPSHQEF